MNTQELMEEVYARTGKSTEFCPYTDPNNVATFDITRGESVALLRVVNLALLRIANWKYPDGHYLRFRSLFARKFFGYTDPANYPKTGNVISAASPNVAVIPGYATNEAGQFDNWIIEITSGLGSGQKRLIIESTLAAGTNMNIKVHEAWDTVPDATSVIRLSKAFFRFYDDTAIATHRLQHIEIDPVTELQDVLKVRDMSQLSELQHKDRTEFFTSSRLSIGNPGVFYVFENMLVFDTAPSAAATYELLYAKHPPALTTAVQIPDIPVSFHEAVAMYATNRILEQQHDFDAAYAVKRDLMDHMVLTRQQGELTYEYDNAGWILY